MFLYRGIRKVDNFRNCDPITVDNARVTMRNCGLLISMRGDKTRCKYAYRGVQCRHLIPAVNARAAWS